MSYRQVRDLADKATRRRIRRLSSFPESAGKAPHLSDARCVEQHQSGKFILLSLFFKLGNARANNPMLATNPPEENKYIVRDICKGPI